MCRPFEGDIKFLSKILLVLQTGAIVEGFATEAVLQKCGDAEDVGGDGA